jgi:hypothetical protein
MDTLVKIFQLPIAILNGFGFFVAGIWLLVIGEWRSVVAGIVISIVAPFFLGLAVLPSMIFGGPGIYFAKRNLTIGLYFFSFLSSIYIAVIITAWCGGVTFYFMQNVPSHAFWPMLIWSYGVATSPWTYMAQRDESIAAFLAAFFTQAAFVVMMISIALGTDLAVAAQIFALVMAVEVFFHVRLIAQAQRMGLLQAEL